MAAYWYRPSRESASGSERKEKDFHIRKVQLTPPRQQEKWFHWPTKKKPSNEHEERRCPVFDATGNEAAANLRTQHDNRMSIMTGVTGPTSSHRPRCTGASVSDPGMHYLDQQSQDENSPLTRELGSRNAGLASATEKRLPIAHRFFIMNIRDDEAPLDTPIDSHSRQQLLKLSAEGGSRPSKTATRNRFFVTPVNEQASSSVSSMESKSAVARKRFSVSPIVLSTVVESAVENEQRSVARCNPFTVTKVTEVSGALKKRADQSSSCASTASRPSGSSLVGQSPSGTFMSTQIDSSTRTSSESFEVFENSPQYVNLSNVLRPSPSSVMKAASQGPKLVSKASSTSLLTPSENNLSSANSSTPMFTPPTQPSTPMFTPPTQPSTPMFTPPTQPSTPMFTPPTQPSTPMFTPPTQPSTPMFTPPTQPSSPMSTPPTQPSTPMSTPPTQPSTPIFTPPTQPSTPMFTPPTQPSTPMFTPPTQPSTPMFTPPTQPSTPMFTPPTQPSSPMSTPPTQPSTPIFTPPTQPSTPIFTPPTQPSTPMFTPPTHPSNLSLTPSTQEAAEWTPPTPLTSPEDRDTGPSRGTPMYTPVESPETVSAPLVTRKPVAARGLPFTRHSIVLPSGFKNLSRIAEQSPNEEPTVKPSLQKQTSRGGDRPKDTRQETLSSVKHITRFHFSVVGSGSKKSPAAVVAETPTYDAERKRYKDALRSVEGGKTSEKQRAALDGVPSVLVKQQQRSRSMDSAGISQSLCPKAAANAIPADDHEFVSRSSLAELYAKVMADCNRTDAIFRGFNRRLDALQRMADAADVRRPSAQ